MRSPLALILALFGLLFGGGAVGAALAAVFAPESWLAAAVSFFALPVAFAFGLQLWYGFALVTVIPLVVRYLLAARSSSPSSNAAERPDRLRSARAPLPGTFVFAPASSLAGLTAGVASAFVSEYPGLLVVFVYWAVGTIHGVIAWRLARAGVLVPPDTI